MAQSIERSVGRLSPASKISAIGLGGFHLGVPDDPEVAVELVRYAVESGITFLDNSWDYHDGESERRMGRALSVPGLRERAFVMTKVDSRSYDGLMRQTEESLSRLQISQLDLLQLHEVIHPDDFERTYREGGLDALVRLRDEGVARHIGITGHKDPAIMAGFVEAAAARDVQLDSAQMPINAFDVMNRSFRLELLPVCERHGVAALGMKPLGAGDFLKRTSVDADSLLRWALAQPTAVCITGCESKADLDQALSALAAGPLTPEAAADLERQVSSFAGRESALESYKVTLEHDGTTSNPEWLA